MNIKKREPAIEGTELATVKELFPDDTGELLVDEMYKFIEFSRKSAFLGLFWINISKFVLSLHGEIVDSWENYALI